MCNIIYLYSGTAVTGSCGRHCRKPSEGMALLLKSKTPKVLAEIANPHPCARDGGPSHGMCHCTELMWLPVGHDGLVGHAKEGLRFSELKDNLVLLSDRPQWSHSPPTALSSAGVPRGGHTHRSSCSECMVG